RRAIANKEFREDLYYRLKVIEIKLPPLRERKGDVPVLVNHFLQKICKRMNRPTVSISPEAIEPLEKYGWPGNVRELENVIERCVVLCDGGTVELEDIPREIRRAVEFGLDVEAVSGGYPAIAGATLAAGESAGDLPGFRDARDAFEKEYLLRALSVAKGNVSEASRITGLSRRHF